MKTNLIPLVYGACLSLLQCKARVLGTIRSLRSFAAKKAPVNRSLNKGCRKMNACRIAFILGLFSPLLFAQPQRIQFQTQEQAAPHAEAGPERALMRFAQWGRNEIFAEYGSSVTSENHFDAALGFRYLLTSTTLKSDGKWDWTVALSYQGDFDFFASSRESGPVVTTRHNPALTYIRVRDPKQHSWSSWYFSVEHESNGQTSNDPQDLAEQVEILTPDEESLPQSEIFEMAQQTISRANNFIGLGGYFQSVTTDEEGCRNDFRCFSIQTKLRFQLGIGREDGIPYRNDFTDPLPQTIPQLKHFQGTQVIIAKPFDLGGIRQSLELDYQTGQLADKPFSNHTFDFRYFIDVPVGHLFNKGKDFAIPIVVRYHHGYLEELYMFSKRTRFFAVGFHARY